MSEEKNACAFTLRFASADDAAALLAIYAPFVRDTRVTYEYEAPSVEAFMGRIAEIGGMYPYLAAVADGRIAGYAYAHRYRERAAYDWSAETSIYIDPAYCGMGIGRALYGALLELLTLQGVHCALACISLPNPASVGLQERFGFQHVATLRQVGFKLGQWSDSATYTKLLGDSSAPSAPVRPIGALAKDAVQAVLARYSRS